MKIFCFSPFGYEGALVSIEVDLKRGIPAIDIVGLADGAVKESRERMKSAISNTGLEFPSERILISLSPADLKKEGAGFDLAVALAVLNAKKSAAEKDSFPAGDLGDVGILVMGELELNGNIRPVKAVHAACSTALSSGIRLCIVPEKNADEARCVEGMNVFGAATLGDAWDALYSKENFTAKNLDAEMDKFLAENDGFEEINGMIFPKIEPSMDFAEVRNQKKLVRALQIAAAGGHNTLAFGAPGCGKTLSMQKFPSLLPVLSLDEAQTVTRIYSIAGLLPEKSCIKRIPPFRQPHQTATIEGICGGGMHCLPGEITLAHKGVLFLDEAAEFRSSVLQMLRVPLESKSITLSRAGRSTVYPADFQLLLSTNPCPCGNYGSAEKICLCSARAVEQYWRKFSGPLLDRIDIRVQVEAYSSPNENPGGKTSTLELRREIADALRIQYCRQGKKNGNLNAGETEKFCVMDEGARKKLADATMKYDFSGRAVNSCMKLSRTIADMKKKETISTEEMDEAITLRKTAEKIF